MIRTTGIGLLLCCILLQCCSKTGIFVHYLLNEKSITELFCVNKGRPQLQCNGKCHVSKTLAEDSKRETQAAPGIKDKWEQLISEPVTGLLQLPPCCEMKGVLFAPAREGRLTGSYKDIFHPPQLD